MSRININTIAKQAKVSTTTVSKFINGTETLPISRRNRQMICRVMRELNYRPHVGGSMISRKGPRPQRVGFVYGEHVEPNAFYLMRLPHIEGVLGALSHELVKERSKLEVLSIKDEHSRAEWNESLLDIDFVVNYGKIHTLMVDMLVRRNIPWVAVCDAADCRVHGEWEDEAPAFDFFYWRSDRQIEALFERFYARGARRFAFFSSWNVQSVRPDWYSMGPELKVRGFQSALRRYPDATGEVLSPALPENHASSFEFEIARRMVAEHAGRLDGVDAILCHDDIFANGVISMLRERGVAEAELPFVSGEGNFEAWRHWSPRIVTSSVDYAELARRLVGVVKEHENGPPDRPAMRGEVPTVIIDRTRGLSTPEAEWVGSES